MERRNKSIVRKRNSKEGRKEIGEAANMQIIKKERKKGNIRTRSLHSMNIFQEIGFCEEKEAHGTVQSLSVHVQYLVHNQ